MEPEGAATVTLPAEVTGTEVALAAETPVTKTAVPVAATPPTRTLVVLLAYGADDAFWLSPVPAEGADEIPLAVTLLMKLEMLVTASETDDSVELIPAVVKFVAEPVVKGAREEVVKLAEEAVEFVEAGSAFQGNELRAEVVLAIEVGAAADVTSTEVVLGGYAVLPSTLEGIGRDVMLVR